MAIKQLRAQYPGIGSSSELLQQLTTLPETRSVLYIAAHPDDENTRLLGWLANEKKVRTGYLSLTRGDGGQNLIGGEQGVELGLIRTQELLAARRTDGAEQFFTRAYDFGFSKSADEALAKWGREAVLSDVVAIIRRFRPDVIITRFPGDARAGHGHHSASAILANEAFTAAADPKRFPEQLRNGLQPWQATRILWNTFNFGGNNTTAEGQFRVNVGGFNALLGKGYGEIASESRSQHKSQGFGVARQRGRSYEYFLTTGGSAPVNDLFDGVDSVAKAPKTAATLAKWSKQLVDEFRPMQPAASHPVLASLYGDLQRIGAGAEDGVRLRKMAKVEELISRLAGIYFEPVTNRQTASSGDSLQITCQLNTQTTQQLVFERIELSGFAQASWPVSNPEIQPNVPYLLTNKILIPAGAPYTEPYWLKEPLSGTLFAQPAAELGKPWTDPALTATLYYRLGDLSLRRTVPVQFRYTDPVKGELFEPLTILPAVEEKYGKDLYVSVNGEVVTVTTETKKSGDAQTRPLVQTQVITPASTGLQPLQILRSPVYSKTIRYDHLPPITYLNRQPAKLLNVALQRTKGLKVGYIPGAGDRVADALEALGYAVTIIEPKDLLSADLSDYKTIVTGIRAYNVHPEMAAAYDKLMSYVNQGGHLIVQYNTNNQLGSVNGRIGPYPFTISRTRVTEEDASVRLLKPEHPFLNSPNRITDDDFAGWVQERSIYQAEGMAAQYETLFSMNDREEVGSAGSLITTAFGKGRFTYTGLVFFRQLPAGVAGAYRLMANLVEAK